jgi:type II secretory pathway pseudopilin PulG
MQKKLKGFSILELMLSAALFSIFSVSITLAVLQGSSATQSVITAELARQRAIEGIEAVRAIRAQSFDALQDTPSTGVQFNNGKWEFFGTQDEQNGFVRTISVQSGQRDSNGNIVDSGGTEDADLKLIIVTVTKNNFFLNFSTYLSRREVVVNNP